MKKSVKEKIVFFLPALIIFCIAGLITYFGLADTVNFVRTVFMYTTDYEVYYDLKTSCAGAREIVAGHDGSAHYEFLMELIDRRCWIKF